MHHPVSAADPAECESEPIHRPGAVQPHGVLLAVDEATTVVVTHSDNLDLLGPGVPALVNGRPLADFLPPGAVAEILGDIDGQASDMHLRDVRIDGRAFDLVLHRGAASRSPLLAELIPQQGARPATLELLRAVQDILGAIRAAEAEGEACTAAVAGIRALTGFDRVMVYRFAPDWSGEVVAEDRAGPTVSYLGHRFPASDIPPPARALYAQAPVRLIPDVDAAPVALVGVGYAASAGPFDAVSLDLSPSLLRAVSPVHLEYLRNMGVGGSMSVSLVREGGLWGLIACHHARPLAAPCAELLRACRLVAGALVDRLELLRTAREAQDRDAVRAVQWRMLRDIGQGLGHRESLLCCAGDLAGMMGADGLALHDPDGTALFGSTPPGDAVGRLAAALRAGPGGEAFETDHLGAFMREDAGGPVTGGALAIALDPKYRSMLIWFRGEERRTVVWAGEPAKRVKAGADGEPPRLAPRASFAAWVEERRGRSRPWTARERRLAAEVRTLVLDVVVERAIEVVRLNRELARSNEELDLFASVVSHDLRSPLRGIGMLSRGLQEDMALFLTEEGRKDLESIQARTARLRGMLDELLGYARVGRDAAGLAEQIALRALIDEVVVIAGPPLGFRVEVECAVPGIVGERGPLRLVLLNLVQNAIDHHDRENGQIAVRAKGRGDGRVLFSVEDDGPGVPPARRSAMFRPFGAHGAKRGGATGSGLGLAMARRFVDQRLGTIAVEPRGDGARGTVVRFTWPVRPPLAGPAP